MDDAELLERARRGDEAAFSRLFARHQRAVHRYAVYMCGRDAADDVVQETFLAVLRRGTRRDGDGAAPASASVPAPAVSAVGPYLMGIARHLALKRMASAANGAHGVHGTNGAGALDAIVDSSVAEQPSALDELTRAETIEAVRAAVETLPPVYREAIVLCELEEMDYATAAIVMQCPIGTVRSRLHRARALLLAKLSAAQPAPAAAAAAGPTEPATATRGRGVKHGV